VQTELELIGLFAFGISGAFMAIQRDFDVVGIAILAIITALGGGILRDVVLGDTPPPAFTQWEYLAVPLAAALVAFFAHPAIGRLMRALLIFDAAGLALFCVVGALKAVEYGLGPLPAALMGMVTGIGGGMLRDVLAGRVPIVLRGELYATPALVGAGIAVLGVAAGIDEVLVAVAGAVVCLVWRLLAMRRGWTAPRPSGAAST
jgi:uncharacterized membrane protein YeiH